MCRDQATFTSGRLNTANPEPRWHTRREVEAMIQNTTGQLCADGKRILGMLDRAGVFKPAELADGLYRCTSSQFHWDGADYVLRRKAGRWVLANGDEVPTQSTVRAVARLDERPLDV